MEQTGGEAGILLFLKIFIHFPFMSGQHLIWGYVPVEGKVCRGEMQGEGRCRFGSGPKGAEGLGGFRAIFSFWKGSQHIDPSGDFAPASMGIGVLRFGSF